MGRRAAPRHLRRRARAEPVLQRPARRRARQLVSFCRNGAELFQIERPEMPFRCDFAHDGFARLRQLLVGGTELPVVESRAAANPKLAP